MERETGIRLLGIRPLAAIDLRIVQSVCQEQGSLLAAVLQYLFIAACRLVDRPVKKLLSGSP